MSDFLWLFAIVTCVTAFIGWVTNWAAVKMIFHPEKFLGLGPLGWQAIIVRRGDKFATGVADMVTQNLITAEELAGRFDPDELQSVFSDTLDDELPKMCREAASVIQPGAWENLPEHVKEMALGQVKVQSRALGDTIFARLRALVPELLDLHALVFRQLSGKNVQRLSRLTWEIGHKEFRFIELSGGVFGFIIGLAQIAIWGLMQTWWLMPIVGAIVGLGTNWLAIQMIFRPQEPRRYLGFRYQGLFPKRQADISRDYGKVSAREILTARVFLDVLTTGEAGERVRAVVAETVSAHLKTEWEKVAPMIPIAVSADKLDEIAGLIVARIGASAARIQPEIETYVETKLEVAHTVESRLAALPKADFERVLRGVFEEDEITLVLVGGFLGLAVGILQAVLALAM